ncbi:hypothetical protein ACVHNB_34195 [Streptomyces sp. YJ-C3]
MANDPFANMSHEEMLAALDQANPGTVQAGADRLLAAAKAVEKAAAELKTRPQYVEWKGDGGDSFRVWAGDLANATLRISDYASESGNFLSHAADAIARTKSSIPRDDSGAQANIDAAKAAPHDPDAASVLAKATMQKEAVRQQAADEMNKLGQAYQQSAERMTALEPPKIPPPPAAILPDQKDGVSGSQHVGFPGGSTGSGGTAGPDTVSAGHTGTPAGTARAVQPATSGHGGTVSADSTPNVEQLSAHTGIDSVGTLPDARTTGPTTATTPPTQGPSASGSSTPIVPLPPMTGPSTGRTGTFPGGRVPTGPGQTAGQGRTVGTGRSGEFGGTARSRTSGPGFEEGRSNAGTGRASGTGTGPYGRAPGDTSRGIVGGRPSQTSTGRTTPYRGTVVGREPEGQTTGRGTTTGGTGRTAPGGQVNGRGVTGQTTEGRAGATSRAGARSAGRVGSIGEEEAAGRTGASRGQAAAGRAGTAGRGVMGAPEAQRTVRTASGERAVPGSAAERGGIAGGSGSAQRDNKKKRRQDRRDQRPEFVTEDEETWLPDGRRIVPPTVD